MLDGICPKCTSHSVYFGERVANPPYGDNTILISSGLFASSRAPLSYYVCINCGYVESYIYDAKSLNDIHKTWQYIPVKRDE